MLPILTETAWNCAADPETKNAAALAAAFFGQLAAAEQLQGTTAPPAWQLPIRT
jgi:hypothetical protein